MNFKVWTILAAVLIFIIYLQASVFAQENKLKFCMVDDTLLYEMKSSASCPILDNSNNDQIECIVTIDRVTCIRHLINNEVDFIIAEPEDLMILGMSKDYNSGILVTHELETVNKVTDSYKMVAVVHKKIEDIWHTEEKRFCSPGFESGVLTRDYVKYFENRLISRKCDPNKSLLEDRMATLSQYFKSACISGPWTCDHQIDNKLKEKYGNLCSQCGNFSTCSSKDIYFGKWGALRCLTTGKGDVTWATLDAVRQNLQDTNNKNEYSFLCPDGGTKNLGDDPCIWLEEPRRTVIVTMDAAGKLGKFIQNPQNTADVWRLFLGKPGSVEIPRTPLDYLKTSFPEYYSMKYYAKCKPDRSIKWCVTTYLEANKCNWISYAAQNHGLEPLIICIQEPSRQDCIDSVKKGTSDIFAILPQEEVEATKRGLQNIVYFITNKGDGNVTAALVHKFSNFTSLKDLKNHKACFSGYRDFGWNSFIYMMKQLTGNNDWYSKDKEMVSQFFSESCVADLHEKNKTEEHLPKNLHSLCSQSTKKKRSCPSQSGIPKYFKRRRNPSTIVERFETLKTEDLEHANQVMLNCLNHNGAHVAFINLSSLMQDYPDSVGPVFKILCLNESMSEYTELCYTARRSLGSLVINENVSEARKEDIYLLLVDIDRLFGVTYQVLSRQISLYGPFDGFSSIIFPKHTQYLDRKYCRSRCSLDYDEVLKDISSNYYQSSSKLISLRQELYFLLILLLIYILSVSF